MRMRWGLMSKYQTKDMHPSRHALATDNAPVMIAERAQEMFTTRSARVS